MRRELASAGAIKGLAVVLLISSIAVAVPPLTPMDPGPSEPIAAVSNLLDDANLQGRFIFSIDFDQEGVAWLATSDGLHAYDGYRWRRYTTADGLPSNLIRCVLSTSSGDLWVGTERGLARRDGHRFRPLPPEQGGPAGPNIRRIYEDVDGTLWFCSDQWIHTDATGGLASLRDGHWTIYGEEDGLPSEYVSDCFRDSRGRFFVLTAAGLAVRDGERWRRPLEEQQLQGYGRYFWSIAETGDGSIVAGTRRCFFVLEDGAWRRVVRDHPRSNLPKFNGIAGGEIMTVGDELVKHFHRWDGDAFEPVSPSFEAAGSVEQVKEAPDGALWAVGHGLLVRWDRAGGEWHRWPNLPPPVALDDEGRTWFADADRVLALTSDGWFALPDAQPSLVFDPDGEIWSFGPEELVRHAAAAPTRYGAAAMGLRSIRQVSFDTVDGSLFVHGVEPSGSLTIVRRFAEEWRHLSFEDSGGSLVSYSDNPAGGVCCLVEQAPLGDLLLIHVTGDREQRIDLPDIRTIDRPTLHVDAGGGTWLYGAFGLLHRPASGGGWRSIEGLPGLNVTQSLNLDESVWFTTDGMSGGRPGAARYAKGKWSFFPIDTDHIAGRGSSGIILASEGAVIRQGPFGALTRLQLPFDRRVESASGDQQGRVWFAAEGRVISFTSDGIPPETVVVGKVREVLRNRPIPFVFEGVERFKPRAPEQLEYSWRIDGGRWTPFSPLPVKGIDTQLRNGRHVLEVRARDQGLDVDETPARLAFAVVPPPLQVRWWFWPLALALFVLVTVLAVVALASRSRIRSYATNLEALVNSRTAELAESETRFRLLVERSPYGICELDREGRVISINAAGADLLSQRTASELAGEDLRVVTAGLQFDALSQHLLHGRPSTVEVTAARDRQCLAHLVPIRYRNGEVERFMLLLVDVTEQKLAEQHQQMLMTELDHRVKNNLAAILSLVEQTLASTPSPEAFSATFTGRIRALARTHDALASTKWRGVWMREVISMIIGPYAVEQQIILEGEDVLLPSRLSSSLMMTLHELTTNAVKYGALSTREGKVRVRWRTYRDPQHTRRLELEWIEENGPEVGSMREGGVGLALMAGFIRHDLKGDLAIEHERTGVCCRISIPLRTHAAGERRA